MWIDKVCEILVIGGGPAGLTAAHELSKNKRSVAVVESHPERLGGISRTEEHRGYRFDIGGHRFFSKSDRVNAFWNEILPNDFLNRPRSSRIIYRGKLFTYPLRAFEALTRLGLIEASRCVLSFAYYQVAPYRAPKNFEQWVCNRFGRRLFEIFFKTYTEKVWGMKCDEISADWAAQRIQNFSLGRAIVTALSPAWLAKGREKSIKTLIDSFRYPRLGPGMMWETVGERVVEQGGEICRGYRVTSLKHDAENGRWTVTCVSTRGAAYPAIRYTAQHVISTMPLRELVGSVEPALQTRPQALELRYRDFLTVALMVKDSGRIADNWLYVHEPKVQVGRIQNFKSWSPEMVPIEGTTCYGLEYFCFENDALWSSSDEKLIRLARKELTSLGIAHDADIFDGHVIRQAKAYPVYDDNYLERIRDIRTEIDERFRGSLHPIGRNGMHKYNNQDHAMMTAFLCAENILAGKPLYDVWRVNEDAEYHEEIQPDSDAGSRLVPKKAA